MAFRQRLDLNRGGELCGVDPQQLVPGLCGGRVPLDEGPVAAFLFPDGDSRRRRVQTVDLEGGGGLSTDDQVLGPFQDATCQLGDLFETGMIGWWPQQLSEGRIV